MSELTTVQEIDVVKNNTLIPQALFLSSFARIGKVGKLYAVFAASSSSTNSVWFTVTDKTFANSGYAPLYDNTGAIVGSVYYEKDNNKIKVLSNINTPNTIRFDIDCFFN